MSILSVRWTARRPLLAVCIACVLTAGLVIGCSSDENAASDESSAIDQLTARGESGGRFHDPSNVVELLPNHVYRFEDLPEFQYSTDLVRGRVVGAERALAYRDASENPDVDGDGEVVDFDAADAQWATFHLDVEVEEVISGEFEADVVGESIVVGLVLDPSTQPEAVFSELSDLDLILPLKRGSVVFDYDESVFAVARDGSMIVVADEDGRLSIPARPREEKALLADAPTMDALVEAAKRPTVVLEVAE